MRGFRDAVVWTEKGFVDSCSFYVDGGRISRMYSQANDADLAEFEGVAMTSLKGKRVIPGFIDQHLHGSMGVDFMDGDVRGNQMLGTYLPSLGVTAFLATTLTGTLTAIANAVEGIYEGFFLNGQMSGASSEPGAECLGIHLEGPFISPLKKGAQDPEYILAPTITDFQRIVGKREAIVRMVTLAPECDTDHTLIRYLSQRGIVVSMGHSSGTYDEMSAAVKAGVSCVTHCYNAMSGISSREGGVLNAALTTDILFAEVIADGFHVSEENLRLFHRLKPRHQKILITDAMRARGLPEGMYKLGSLDAYHSGDTVRLADHTLAGSVVNPTTALKTYMRATGCALEEAVQLFTRNPARLLGVDTRKGRIAPGYDADFVVLSEDLEILQTYCKGILCYEKRSESPSL